MSSLKAVFICAGINFKKWCINPRIYTVFAVSFVFLAYVFSGVPKICAYYHTPVTPWVFPFYLGNPMMFIIFGGLAMLFYCDAPFLDGNALFLIARAGRRNWIWGQFLYICASAMVLTLYNVLFSVLLLLPHLVFSSDWGSLLWTLARSSAQVYEQTGVSLGFLPFDMLMEIRSPAEVMAAAVLLFWLGNVFLGMLIFCFHILTGKMLGLVLGGLFTCMGYFVCYVGILTLGRWIYYLSPVTWSSVNYLDWFGMGDIPAPGFAIAAFALMIGGMALISVKVFCEKDLALQKGV